MERNVSPTTLKTKKNKRLIIIPSIIVFLLFIPLLAMQFSSEFNWTIFDFIIMGILLLVTGISCEMVLRKVTRLRHRIVACLVIIVVFFIIWAELAVGIFGALLSGS